MSKLIGSLKFSADTTLCQQSLIRDPDVCAIGLHASSKCLNCGRCTEKGGLEKGTMCIMQWYKISEFI